jgi:hypothetical protein
MNASCGTVVATVGSSAIPCIVGAASKTKATLLGSVSGSRREAETVALAPSKGIHCDVIVEFNAVLC